MLLVVKEQRRQHRLLYPAELSVISEIERKTFPDKHNLKEYVITQPNLQKILDGIFQAEEKDSNTEETTGRK